MGIGNTSSASLIMSSVLGLPIEDCIGRGTGTDDEQLWTKIKVLKQVYAFHKVHELSSSPLELLCKIGGLEIAQMIGAYLQAFAEKMIIVVDGFIATAALLIAHQINPLVLNNCIFAHTSSEKGHSSILNYFKVKPLLNLLTHHRILLRCLGKDALLIFCIFLKDWNTPSEFRLVKTF